jgi:ribose transport system ATP-binding protein
VLIARALATNADIILLDDPMRGVDVSSKREMFELIRQEADQGKCFVLYTTETEELANCDRVYVFYQGVITAEIAQHDLSEDRILAASFGRTMEPSYVAA